MTEHYKRRLEVLKARAEAQVKSHSEIIAELPNKCTRIKDDRCLLKLSEARYTRLAKLANVEIEKQYIINQILALRLDEDESYLFGNDSFTTLQTGGSSIATGHVGFPTVFPEVLGEIETTMTVQSQQTEYSSLRPNISLEKAENFHNETVDVPSFPKITMDVPGLFKYENAEYNNIIHAISEVIKKVNDMIAFPATKKELWEREGDTQLKIEISMGSVAELMLTPGGIHLPKLHGGDRIEILQNRSQPIESFRLGFHEWKIQTTSGIRLLVPSYDPEYILKQLRPSGLGLTNSNFLRWYLEGARSKPLSANFPPHSNCTVKTFAETEFYDVTRPFTFPEYGGNTYEKKGDQIFLKFTLYTNINLRNTEAIFTEYITQADKVLIPILKLNKDAEEAIAETEAAQKLLVTEIERIKKTIANTKEKIVQDVDKLFRTILRNIDEKDKDGNTVLHKAVMRGNIFAVNLFRDPKTLRIRNNTGKTPLNLAQNIELEAPREEITKQLAEELTQQEYNEQAEKILQSLRDQ